MPRVDPMEIRRLIISAGLTQQEAAELVFMPLRTFERKLAGETDFSYAEAHTLHALIDPIKRAIAALDSRQNVGSNPEKSA